METITKEQIIEERKATEQELEELLSEMKSNFTLADIKEIIYQEDDEGDLMKIVAIFDRGGDVSELSNILELANDAWNYFPHKLLEGLSPLEVVLKQQEEKIDKLDIG